MLRIGLDMKPLNNRDTRKLQEKNLIGTNEIAYIIDNTDTVLVENVVSGAKRVIDLKGHRDLVLESTKKLLKD